MQQFEAGLAAPEHSIFAFYSLLVYAQQYRFGGTQGVISRIGIIVDETQAPIHCGDDGITVVRCDSSWQFELR